MDGVGKRINQMQLDEARKVIGCLGRGRKENETEIRIGVSKDTFDFLTADYCRLLCRALLYSGYRPLFGSCRYCGGQLMLGGLSFCTIPRFEAKTEGEMRKVFQLVRQKKAKDFFIILRGALIRKCLEKESRELFLLEQDVYMSSGKFTIYTTAGIVEFRDFAFEENHTLKYLQSTYSSRNGSDSRFYCASVKEAINHVEAMTMKDAGEISFLCTPGTYRKLMEEGEPGEHGKLLLRYSALKYNAGIMHSDDVCWSWNNRISLDNIQYYPGMKVFRAVKNRRIGRLSTRERKLLNAARELVASVDAADPAEKALLISHEIGKRTQYVIDDTTEEDDCAYGPLLNGKANCDGFADAFYLCASLAGLCVRFQYGDSSKPHEEDKDAAHMWNLVRINHQWLALDATWDNYGNKECVDWKHCLIGADRAERIYLWNHDMSPTLASETDPHRAAGIREYVCSSKEEAVQALSRTVKRKDPLVYLFMTKPGILDQAEKLFDCMNPIRGYRHYCVMKIEEFHAWKVRIDY